MNIKLDKKKIEHELSYFVDAYMYINDAVKFVKGVLEAHGYTVEIVEEEGLKG